MVFGGRQRGHQIEQSAIFDSADSSYLTAQAHSASNTKTWSVSMWVKLTDLSNNQTFISAGYALNERIQLVYNAPTNKLRVYFASAAAGSAEAGFEADIALRDTADWYHIVFYADSTQATASNRWGIDINGVPASKTVTAGTGYPNLNASLFINSIHSHRIGVFAYDTSQLKFNSLLSEVILVDGQADVVKGFVTPQLSRFLPLH